MVPEGGLDGGLETRPGAQHLVEPRAVAGGLRGPQATHPRLRPADRRGQLPAPAAHALEARLHAAEGPGGLGRQAPRPVAGPLLRARPRSPARPPAVGPVPPRTGPQRRPSGERAADRARSLSSSAANRDRSRPDSELSASGQLRVPLPVARLPPRRVAFGGERLGPLLQPGELARRALELLPQLREDGVPVVRGARSRTPGEGACGRRGGSRPSGPPWRPPAPRRAFRLPRGSP